MLLREWDFVFQSRMIKGTVKDGSLLVVKDWLKVASSKGEIAIDHVLILCPGNRLAN